MITRRQSRNLQTRNTENKSADNHDSYLVVPSDSSQLSEETFGSAYSLPFDAKSWHDVKRKLESLAWIQCDNQSCMKWRKVPREELADVSEADKWFCHQNNDPNFNSCDVPEEDVKAFDLLADRCGLKYLKSQLRSGALVWAKMNGYCSWPAVITPEPETENGHLSKDDNDEITHYHVEFLGQPRSHGWVCSKDVTSFTAASVDKHLALAQQKLTQHCKRKGKRNQGWSKSHSTALQKTKTMCKTGVSVESGIAEAMKLIPISPSERLKECVYVSRKQFQQQNCGIGKHEIQQHSRQEHSHSKENVPDQNHRERETQPANEKLKNLIHRYTSFDSSLNSKTKEERLLLDIKMYKRKERMFNRNVTQFMKENRLETWASPVWQNKRISQFELFLAVHERGGFKQVTAQRAWRAVYREVTELPNSSDSRDRKTVKQCYQEYLYPYELYLRGQNFKDLTLKTVQQTSMTTIHDASDFKDIGENKRRKLVSNHHSQKESCFIEDAEIVVEEDITSDSLMEMLQNLDKISWPASPVSAEHEKGGNDVAGDETANIQQVQQSQENVSHMSTQEKLSSQVDTDHFRELVASTEDKVGACSDSACSQELLNELDAIQAGINFIDHIMK